MEVGEVRVAMDSDFMKLRDLCEEIDGWKVEYNKNGISVHTKHNDISDFKMVKIRSVMNYSAQTVYDVLHDPEYRKVWDHSMKESYEIGYLNPNNDIGYYSLKCPSPMKNRDFVLQRSWLDTGPHLYILNHSVNHEDLPPRKGIVRGISYLTGYWLKVLTPKSCEFNYVTQADPKGKLPKWLVNRATHIVAPKTVKLVQKACKGYDSWKAKNNPNQKPWIYPEQIKVPRINLEDPKILPMDHAQSMDSLDESELKESDMSQSELSELNAGENGDI
ncbi:unnamed protein product [Owenia fusiformis]|uniref:START domain-containing protein 10 n=1 Tax=Owenia fusiformis TaxID=6347 RepID=A0A8J1TG90_OWEFU|nr:unnamed protein product [Owenia fusiformis]